MDERVTGGKERRSGSVRTEIAQEILYVSDTPRMQPIAILGCTSQPIFQNWPPAEPSIPRSSDR